MNIFLYIVFTQWAAARKKNIKMTFQLGLSDCVSLIAIALSIITFAITIYDRRVKLSATLNGVGDENSIDIYNLSNKKVTIPYFELYRSKCRYFTTKIPANTPFDWSFNSKFVIPPYESISIEFKDENKINNFVAAALPEHIYLRLQIYGKKYKTIRLR